MLKYLLDTSIAIHVVKRRPVEALVHFNRHAGHLGMSAISHAELIHGVEKSAMPEHDFPVMKDFCSRQTILDY